MRTLQVICAVALLNVCVTLSEGAVVTLQAGVGGQPADIIEDAMLVQNSANDNFGGRTDLEIGVPGNSQVRDAVMRFDVTNPLLGLFEGGQAKFKSIDAITLTLTTTGQTVNQTISDNMDIRVSAAVESQGDWVEGTGTTAASGGDAGNVTYSERREGAGTAWSPNTNYHRGTGEGVLGTQTTWPGLNTSFDISFTAPGGSIPTLTDLVNGWATGNNEGILINEFNRSGFVRWFLASSEAGTLSARPLLTIEYTGFAPEPSSAILAMFGLVGVGAMGRRRRRRV